MVQESPCRRRAKEFLREKEIRKETCVWEIYAHKMGSLQVRVSEGSNSGGLSIASHCVWPDFAEWAKQAESNWIKICLYGDCLNNWMWESLSLASVGFWVNRPQHGEEINNVGANTQRQHLPCLYNSSQHLLTENLPDPVCWNLASPNE